MCCSIEYWPDPQRGITEAYRVLKKGGKACLIGPVHPTFWLSRFFADVWMLFPTEDEYIDWFTKAGFTDVKLKRIGPSWYRGVRRHGLIMGCSVTGVKPESGPSPLEVCSASARTLAINFERGMKYPIACMDVTSGPVCTQRYMCGSESARNRCSLHVHTDSFGFIANTHNHH